MFFLIKKNARVINSFFYMSKCQMRITNIRCDYLTGKFTNMAFFVSEKYFEFVHALIFCQRDREGGIR